MKYYVVLDMPDTTYPTSDPFYAEGGDDEFGRSSLATYIDISLNEPGAQPLDITVYTSLDWLLQDVREGQ